MSTPSQFDKLDPQILDEVNRLCTDRKLKLEDILEELKKIGVGTSRSALGRHRLKVREVGQFMTASREAAAALKGQLGELDDTEQSRLNQAMIEGQLFQLQMRMMSGEYEPDDMVGDLRKLADLMYRLSASRKLDADRVLKVRQETAKKTISAVDSVLKAAKQPGITKEMRDQINHRVLGVPTP